MAERPLAAELRDLLDELDELYDTLGDLSLDAMFAAQDAGEATPAGKAMSAMFFGIDDQKVAFDRATAQLRAIVVRLECPPARLESAR